MLNKFLTGMMLFLLMGIHSVFASELSPQTKLNLAQIRLGKIICNDPRILKENSSSCVLSPTLKTNASWSKVLQMMETDPNYIKMFQEEYGGKITLENISNAIGAYEQSLTSDSRFDEYLKASKNALTPGEINGYKLFKSYGCAACHDGNNFGGKKFKKMGVAKNYLIGHYTLITPADLGLYEVTKNANDEFVFKVPILRNVGITYPYYHDGSVKSLHDAVFLMGKYQLGIVIPEKDIADIVLFLNSLTAKSLITE